MAIVNESSSFDAVIGPVLNFFSAAQAQQIVDYRADEQLEQRIEELAAKSLAGELTETERAELTGYARASRFLAMLQLQAERKLREVGK